MHQFSKDEKYAEMTNQHQHMHKTYKVTEKTTSRVGVFWGHRVHTQTNDHFTKIHSTSRNMIHKRIKSF